MKANLTLKVKADTPHFAMNSLELSARRVFGSDTALVSQVAIGPGSLKPVPRYTLSRTGNNLCGTPIVTEPEKMSSFSEKLLSAGHRPNR